jgi:hypothetical protein
MNNSTDSADQKPAKEKADDRLHPTAGSPSSIPGAAWHDEYLKASDRAIQMERERNNAIVAASKLAHCLRCHRHDMLAGEDITWEKRDDEALAEYAALYQENS